MSIKGVVFDIGGVLEITLEDMHEGISRLLGELAISKGILSV